MPARHHHPQKYLPSQISQPSLRMDYRSFRSKQAFRSKHRGVLSHEETIKIVKTADIGLSTLYPDKNYLTSLPTKFYEYALCKVPILMSNFPYWEKTFNGMAWFTDPKDPEEIRLSISRIINCSSSRDKVQKAFKKVSTEWNWENEKGKLLSLYSKLLTT